MMIVLRIVPAIGDEFLWYRIAAHAIEKRLEFINIRSWPHPTMCSQNQMCVTVNDDSKFGKNTISRGLPKVWLF